MRLPLVLHPDPRLLIKSTPIEAAKIAHEVAFVRDLVETMIYEGGIGISAPQVGRNVQIIAISTIQSDPKHGIPATVMFNPEITYCSDKKSVFDEGCLSFPGESCQVTRSSLIRVKFFDSNGNLRHNTYVGITAICIQHEIDHLQGITMKMRSNK
jgi:peptide deformylase